MDQPADGLRKVLDRLNSMRPQWSVEISTFFPERGDAPSLYSSKISWRSAGGLVVMMELPVGGPVQASISIFQSYADGSSDHVFSATYDSSDPGFKLLEPFILSVTDSARRARAQRVADARRAFFGT